MELIVGIASLFMSVVSVASLVWIGGFQYSAITHDIKYIKERLEKMDARFDKMDDRFEKIDNRLGRIETDIHNLDKRVNNLEQRNP